MLNERKARLENGSKVFLNLKDKPYLSKSEIFCAQMNLKKEVALRKVNNLLDGSILVMPAENAVDSKSMKDLNELEKLTMLVPVVPSAMKSKIMSSFHDVPECSHLGSKRTRHAIMKRFWWKNMTKDIREFVRSCKICQTVKCVPKAPYGLMGRNMNVAEAMETLFVDIIGRLPRTKNQNEYILVCQCEFTKWVEFHPMRDSTAPTIIKFLEDSVFCRFGFPRKIISDNGTQFVGNVFDDLCKKWGITHKKVSYYAPWGNAVERSNRDLRAMISSFAHDKHREWDIHLQKFALTLRTMVRESLGCSSDILNLGRHIRLPIDREFELKSTKNLTAEEIAEWLPVKLRELRKFVLKNINIAHKNYKKYYDRKRRPSPFKVGDYILLRTHTLSDADAGITKKFSKRWCGPFKLIKEVTPGLSFKVFHEESNTDMGTHHVYHVRPFVANADDKRMNVYEEKLKADKKIVHSKNPRGNDSASGEGHNHNLRKCSKVDYKAMNSKGKVVNLSYLCNFLEFVD